MTSSTSNSSLAPGPSALNGATADSGSDPRKDSLIEYPSLFPIKVMGVQHDDLVSSITTIARRFDPMFDPCTVELRPSSTGKYLGVTITVTATSREQLDNLYRALTSAPHVKVVL